MQRDEQLIFLLCMTEQLVEHLPAAKYAMLQRMYRIATMRSDSGADFLMVLTGFLISFMTLKAFWYPE